MKPSPKPSPEYTRFEVALRHVLSVPKAVVMAEIGDVRALKKLRRVGVGRGRGDPMALVEPVGLPEFPDDGVALAQFPKDQLAHLADVAPQRGPGLPVHGREALDVEREWLIPAELEEVELVPPEGAVRDRLGVRAQLGLGQ